MFAYRIELQEVIPRTQEWLRRSYAQMVTSGAQVLLLMVGMEERTRSVWLPCLGLIALISLCAWLSALYRLRSQRNMPVSTVAAAAQGHVVLEGVGQPFCEPVLRSPLRGRACLWCRYLVEERTDGEWSGVDHGETSDSFMVQDSSGACVVHPETAEILTRHRTEWTDQKTRHTEWLLLPGDRLRVIGQFRSQGGGSAAFDTRSELSALLADWKQDMPRLLARYGTPGCGSLGLAEWEAVRRDALREVTALRDTLRSQPQTHIVSRPTDGALFLISNLPQKQLERRYLLWSWLHLVIFFAALAGMRQVFLTL